MASFRLYVLEKYVHFLSQQKLMKAFRTFLLNTVKTVLPGKH